MNHRLRSALRRLEEEAALWRAEPARRVYALNQPLRPLRVRQFHEFGKHSFLDRPVWLYGPHMISIGARVVILRGCWIAVERAAWEGPAPALTIGDRVGMRMGCTISASESIVVEDDVVMGAHVTIVDGRHTWSSGKPSTLDSPIDTSPVRVGRGTWLADGVTVSGGADIGEQCAVGSNTVVRGTIPDHSLVVGNPARVVGSTR